MYGLVIRGRDGRTHAAVARTKRALALWEAETEEHFGPIIARRRVDSDGRWCGDEDYSDDSIREFPSRAQVIFR